MKRKYELRSSILNTGDFQENKKAKCDIHSVGAFLATTFSIYIIVLFFIVMIVDSRLPHPLKVIDEISNPNSFIAERAQNDLRLLTDIGPRIVGSQENEVTTLQFLVQRLYTIKSEANSVHDIEIDIQTVSGSYFLDFQPFGGYNVYGNVQNIIVKVKSLHNQKGILINAHFDSVPTSPGGSDDGINCAVMLEVLHKFVQEKNPPKNNVLFLFNGAEESPLQASHGFITQHKWRNDVQIVINLEAAGAGAKEILFQSGPNHSWLLDYYSKVPHPHGQAAGEEIFQTNIIPSDTDFRIFRDFGGLIGYDMAFARNGFRYHTNYDDFEHIPLGSYQHIGDNVLSLVKNLAYATEINELTSSVKAVYYDIFGLFMISYSEQTGLILNLFVVLLSFAVFILNMQGFGLSLNKDFLVYMLSTGVAVLAGWVLALISTFVIAVCVDVLNYSMAWYSRPWLLVGLYVTPTVATSSVPIFLLNKLRSPSSMGINIQSQLQAHAVRLIWTGLLLVATCFKIRSAYVLMIPVLFNSFGFAFICIAKQQHSVKLWRFVCEVANTFPTMMIFYYAILILSLFIPITGRIGSNRNPEIIIGLLVYVLTLLGSSFFINFVTLLRKPTIIFVSCLVVSLATLAIVASPMGFPYSGDPDSPAQQRYMIYHTQRMLHGNTTDIRQDSGYFVVNLDRHAPDIVTPYVKSFKKKINISVDCHNLLVCGLPLSHSRILPIMHKQAWIPAKPPMIKEDMKLELIERKLLAPVMVRLLFEASGPTHLNLYLSPKNGTKLFKTNLSDIIPENVPMWNGRPTYFINYTWGKRKAPLRFFLDIEVPNGWDKPVLDIALSGKEFYNKKELYTLHFQQFLNEFPDWCNVMPAVSTFEAWTF